MDRRDARDTYRKRMALAIGVSIGVHALVLSTVRIDLPVFGGAGTERPLRMVELVELPEDWRAAALEVVSLESATSVEVRARSAGSSASATTRATAAAPGRVQAPVSLPSAAPRPSPGSPSLDLTPVAETPEIAPAVATATRPARGILLRADAGQSDVGLDFHAASHAAREAEEEEGRGRALPGRGIGISISGPGSCPAGGGIPAIGIGGGLGGVPTTGKGMGIIGARPPNQGAINRFGPEIGGGR